MKKLGFAALVAFVGLTSGAEAGFIGIDGPDTVTVGDNVTFTINYAVAPSGGAGFDVANYYIQISSTDGGTTTFLPLDFGGSIPYDHLFTSPGLWTIDADMTAVFTYFATGILDDESVHYSKQLEVLPAAVTPVPATLLLFLTALGGLAAAAWRRQSVPVTAPRGSVLSQR